MNDPFIHKILVTGGAGFIGSHLCERLLLGGYHVVSVDNFNEFYDPRIKRDNIQAIQDHFPDDHFISIEADIRNQLDVEAIIKTFRPQAVVHLAAMAGVRPSIENPNLYVDVNVNGTQVLLDACVHNQIGHLIFASSSSVYGNNEKIPFSEKDCVDNPISPYAATKKAGELLCHAYAHLYPIKIACLRFFTVYGPRQRPDLAIHKFTQLMVDGKEIPFFGDGENRRDYTYIDDIIEGVVKAMDWTAADHNKSNYEIFNLGESRTVTLNEMVGYLEQFLDVPAKIKRLPAQAGDVVCTYADISKARMILGYKPSTPIEQGISKFIEWFQSSRLMNEKV